MSKTNVSLLLIEDNPDDAEMISELVDRVPGVTFDLRHETNLSDGLRALGEVGADLVLLDLMLPDSSGLETLQAVLEAPRVLPIVILTGHGDESLGVKAVQMGAQDFLDKNTVSEEMFSRSLRYAVERQRLREQINGEEATCGGSLSLRGRLMGSADISQTAPEAFGDFVDRYGRLLDLAAENRIYKEQHDVSSALREFAGELVYLKAGPKDLADVHTEALERKHGEIDVPKRYALYLDEGRMLLVELMGYLASMYRETCLGFPSEKPARTERKAS
ncbi:response regulator [Desulfohalovibrio reitneri]|uniref:response regulator n=1 Tax=Desulfohalovibrio reitneri TaxID=1307759 RepID=UPI000691874E|nr:response regulator [Desulfohalovibrio reitneri]